MMDGYFGPLLLVNALVGLDCLPQLVLTHDAAQAYLLVWCATSVHDWQGSGGSESRRAVVG